MGSGTAVFPPCSALRSSIFHCVTGRFPLAQEAYPVSQAPPIPAPAEKAVTGVGAVLTCRGDGPGCWLCSLFQTRGLWDKKSGAALFGAAAVTSLVHPSVPPSVAPAGPAGPGPYILFLSGPAGARSAGRCPAPGLPPENSPLPGRAP